MLVPCLRFLLGGLALVSPLMVFAAEPARTDVHGDPLPVGALARLGSVRFRLEGYLYSPALSPDGKVVAVGTQQGQICLVDSTTGKEVRRFQGGINGFTSLTFSPDGKQLALSSFNGLQLFDAATGQVPIAQFERTTRGHRQIIVFSGDGKFLAMGADGFNEKLNATVWDVQTKKQVNSFTPLQNHMVSVALSGDGKRLATWGQHLNRGAGGNNDIPRTIQLWDVTTGKELRQLQIESYHVVAATFSPDGKELAVVEPNAVLSFWDADSGKQLRRCAARRGLGSILRYSPDGKLLDGGGQDGALQLWEAATGNRLALCPGPRCQLSSIAFLGDNRVLAAGVSNQSLCVWEVPSGKERSPVDGHTGSVVSLAFSRDGKRVFSAAVDGMRTWDTATGKPGRHHQLPLSEERRQVGMPGQWLLSPEGKYVVAGAQHTQGLQVFDLGLGEEVCELEYYSQMDGNTRTFANDGTTFAALGMQLTGRNRTAMVRVWDLSSTSALFPGLIALGT